MLELSTYEGIPHLLCLVTEAKATSVLGHSKRNGKQIQINDTSWC